MLVRRRVPPGRSRRGHPPCLPARRRRASRARARDAAAARVRREANVATFFPETFGDREVAIGTRARGMETGMFSPERVSMPPPAVTPPGTVGLGFESAPPRDIFAGDLEAIWRHLEFGRHYHRVAIRRRYEYERAAQHAAQRARGGGGGGGGGGAPGRLRSEPPSEGRRGDNAGARRWGRIRGGGGGGDRRRRRASARPR